MPTMHRKATAGVNTLVASGRIGRLKRMNPYVPIFRRTAARITEPAVGASVCAYGNHVWNGNIVALMRKRARQRGMDRKHRTLDRKPEEEREEHPPLQIERHVRQLLELRDVERVD